MITFYKVEAGGVNEEEFIDFGQFMGTKETLVRKDEEIRAHINESHILNNLYRTYAYIGKVAGKTVIRGALFQYDNSTTVYLGFFASVDNQYYMDQFTNFLLQEVEDMGGTRIVGPVDGSFWYGYRMKLTQFNKKPFTAEPYNPSYYPSLWEGAGFDLIEQYNSNHYRQADDAFDSKRLKARYHQFKDKSIEFVQPKRRNWKDIVPQLYELLIRLYSGFPLFHTISLAQFSQLIQPLKWLIDFTLVRLAYDNSQLVGFIICLPDYGQEVYKKLTIKRVLHILKVRAKAKRYIVMYLGVDKPYMGLASALLYPIVKQIVERKAESIGALIHAGKVTNNYLADMKNDKTTYGLYEIKIKSLLA